LNNDAKVEILKLLKEIILDCRSYDFSINEDTTVTTVCKYELLGAIEDKMMFFNKKLREEGQNDSPE